MDKKRLVKSMPQEDIKGFEEFIDGQPEETSFLPKAVGGTKKETGFEHFTFLTTDSDRLNKLKNLLTEKLPFSSKFEQGKTLLKLQKEEVKNLKNQIFKLSDETNSTYRKSLKEIFDSFFGPPQV